MELDQGAINAVIASNAVFLQFGFPKAERVLQPRDY